MNTELLISFVIVTATLAFSPGPDNIFVLIQSATYGRKSGMAVVGGLMTGCLIHTSLVAFGLSAFIESNGQWYLGLKFFGAAYMLFLAYRVYQSRGNTTNVSTQHPKKNYTQLFRQGFIMNVLNPKVSIFFLAFFPAFLFSETLGFVLQFYVLGFLFILTSFTVFSLFVLLSGFFSKLFLNSPKRIKFLKYIQVGVFVVIALLILLG
ncbi:MAG: LysE family translocator [Flavobacteriaceae bacterium]